MQKIAPFLWFNDQAEDAMKVLYFLFSRTRRSWASVATEREGPVRRER